VISAGCAASSAGAWRIRRDAEDILKDVFSALDSTDRC
jgi:hypothetical protein